MANTPTAEAAAKPAVEVVKNCAGCNKPIKKHNRYFRNGKYYCTKKCCLTTAKTAAAEAKETAEKGKAEEKKGA